MQFKLFDSELKIMDILWRNGDTSAKRIAALLKEQTGWSKTTTYTVIKKCLDKGAVERIEPGFICHPLITMEQIQEHETSQLIKKLFSGHADRLVASIIGQRTLSQKEIERLKQLIEDLK